MKYFVTHFRIDCSKLESEDADLMQTCRYLLADELGECGYESFEDTEQGIDGYVQQEEYHEILLKECLAAFPVEGTVITYQTEAIPEQDWNAAWEQEGFAPIRVKNLITIYDARHTLTDEQFSTPVNIGIHATNAFGTGTHETTRMIVSMLLDVVLEGKRILDCGTGTGILSIAALKCGAAHAMAYDIDEWSVENSKYNAELNGVADRMEVMYGNAGLLSHVEGLFDVVVANINRNILLEDMETFRSVMASGAVLILSGFYKDDAALLKDKAASLGLSETAQMCDNEWCAMEFKIV